MAKDTFDWLAERLAAKTALSDLEARGTLRLALKAAGLDAKSATASSYGVVIERVLVGELLARGVPNAEELCGSLAADLARMAPAGAKESAMSTPEAVFGRLGSR